MYLTVTLGRVFELETYSIVVIFYMWMQQKTFFKIVSSKIVFSIILIFENRVFSVITAVIMEIGT